jgi:hypothetical protein
MVQQDKQSWNKSRADAMQPWASMCPKGLDAPAYASGYIEGFSRVELLVENRNRGKSRGSGMIIRFPRRRESDSLWACRRLRILTV